MVTVILVRLAGEHRSARAATITHLSATAQRAPGQGPGGLLCPQPCAAPGEAKRQQARARREERGVGAPCPPRRSLAPVRAVA